MKMLNNYLLCEEVTKEETGGFSVGDYSEVTKKLRVLQSSEEDIPVGCEIKVPANSGQYDESGIYIKRGEVIVIL